MKTYSDQLFSLIKAMTPKEKLFFKVFSVKKKRNTQEHSYIVLFDVLNNMKIHDEAILQKRLKKSGFKYNIDIAKNYLIKALFKSLREYHSDSSIDAQIHNMLEESEILYKKNLKKMAAQVLHKAEQLSLEFEKYEYLLIIGSLKANLAVDMSDLEALKEFKKTEIKKQQEYLELFINTIDYRNLTVEIGSIFNQSPNVISGNKAAENRLKELFANALLKDSKLALTFSSKQYFYRLHYQNLVNLYKWDEWDETSYRMLKEWVAYLEKKEMMRNSFPEVYIYALAHLIVNSGFKGGKKESEVVFNKAKDFFMELPKKNVNHIVQRAFMDMFTNYTDAQLKLLHPEKCVEALGKINIPKLSHGGYMNMASSYFLLGEYNKAISFINKITNVKSDYRLDVQAGAKMFGLIIHYELRNIDLLPYVAKASERWLIKNNYPLGSFDKALINFFKYKLPKMDSSEEEVEELLRLYTNLKRDKNSDYSILQKEEFYLIPWLESKIQNRPLIEVAKEKRNE